jgi:hypothetical protein
MVDTNSNFTVRQWGRRFPNGVTDWQTEDGWIPVWSTEGGRQEERESYQRSLETLGIAVEHQPQLVFLARTMQVTYSPESEITEAGTQAE